MESKGAMGAWKVSGSVVWWLGFYEGLHLGMLVVVKSAWP